MPDPVQLVNPPFGAIERPSLGLSLLQASAHKAGLPCRTRYPNLTFAERIGLDAYFWFANTGEYIDLFGEWVFSGLVFPDASVNSDQYIERFVANGYSETTFKTLMPGRDLVFTLHETRQLAGEVIEQCADEIVHTGARVVGCTSSFQQNCAALALLKKVRELDSSIVTLLGGPNCEEPMARGLRRAFPWVDFVVSGEAETIFPELLRLLLRYGRNVDEQTLPGCVIGEGRASANKRPQDSRGITWDLDETPLPYFDDYFDELSRSPMAAEISPGLLLEASRGCWWGQKHHCTFCGLNGSAMGFRVKSADRVEDEIKTLCTRHGISKMEFVDNTLDPRLGARLFPRLAERGEPVSLFFEVRVMDRRQFELMALGGVRWLQVGIESFHQELLSLMNKGTSVAQNIQALRWAYELGIRVSYNLLYGLPGERDDWYSEMSRILPLLAHLEPPRSLVPLRYDRFSVYHDNQERFGINLLPRKAYEYVYGLSLEQLSDIATFFEDISGSRPAGGPGLEAVEREWLQWRSGFWKSEPGRERAVLHILPCRGEPGRALYDTRPCAVENVSLLTDLETLVLEYCDTVRGLSDIERHCLESGNTDRQAVLQTIEGLTERRVMIGTESGFLSLPVSPPRQAFLHVKDFPGGYFFPRSGPVSATGRTGSASPIPG